MACGKPVAAMACGDNGLWKACGCMNVRVCVPEPLAPIRENNALKSIEYHTHCDLVSNIILLQQKGARNSYGRTLGIAIVSFFLPLSIGISICRRNGPIGHRTMVLHVRLNQRSLQAAYAWFGTAQLRQTETVAKMWKALRSDNTYLSV